MKCQNCGSENPEHAEFCQECGDRLNKELKIKSKSSNRKYLIFGLIIIIVSIGFIIFNAYSSSVQNNNIQSLVYGTMDSNGNIPQLMNESNPQNKQFIIYQDFELGNITYNSFLFPTNATTTIKVNKYVGKLGQSLQGTSTGFVNSLTITRYNMNRNFQKSYQVTSTESFEEIWEFNLEKKDGKWVVINSKMITSKEINNPSLTEITYKETTSVQ